MVQLVQQTLPLGPVPIQVPAVLPLLMYHGEMSERHGPHPKFVTLDLRSLKTYKVLKDVVKIAAQNELDIVVWISIPCTAGCPWRHINSKKGRITGDIELTSRLIDRCIALSHMADKCWGEDSLGVAFTLRLMARSKSFGTYES